MADLRRVLAEHDLALLRLIAELWGETLTAGSQREAVDGMYKSGIQIIEQTFHVTEAKSADDYRRMVEDLWRKLFDLQKAQSESQFRDFQTFYEKSAALVQDVRS